MQLSFLYVPSVVNHIKIAYPVNIHELSAFQILKYACLYRPLHKINNVRGQSLYIIDIVFHKSRHNKYV